MYHKYTSLPCIVLFLQPLKFLWDSVNTIEALPKLQESSFPFFNDHLKQSLNQGSTIFERTYKTFRTSILYYIGVVQLTVVVKMCVSYTLKETLTQLSSDDPYSSAIMLACLLLVSVTVEQHYFQNIYQMSAKIRLSLSQVLYGKLQSTSLTRIQQVSQGQFFNVVSMDLSDMDLTWLLAFSGSPIIFISGMWMLYSSFGGCSFVGIGALIGIMMFQRYTTGLTGPMKQEKNKLQDDRTRLTDEILHNLKVLKMYALEFVYRDQLISKRCAQDSKSKEILRVDALAYYLNGNINVFIALVLMASSYVWMGEELGSDVVFSSIWILQLIKVWCVTYGQRAYKLVINMRVLEQRLNDILNTVDLNTVEQVATKSTRQSKKKYLVFKEEEEITFDKTEQKPEIQLTNYTGFWTKGQELENKPVLNKISFKVNEPCLIAIMGKVGQSKTSLLLSILQEIPYYSGSVVQQGSMAYVEQNPYIFPGTLQDNILFGCPYNEDHYNDVLQGSALDKDNIDNKYQVGENGCNLSGGQKARLSFCRALYSDAEIYLLDDILSAVDNQVSEQLVNTLIGLRSKGKIILLVTHKKVPADRIYHMESGELIEIQNIFNAEEAKEQENADNQDEQVQVKQEQQNVEVNEVIPQSTYQQYINEGGYLYAFGIIMLYLLDAMLTLKIIGLFGEAELFKAILLMIVYSCINFSKYNGLFYFTINAINNMHRKLITAVVRSKVSEIQNIGQLMSRFTTDLSNVECMVMLDFHWVIEGVIDNVFVIIVVSLSRFIIILSLIFLIAMFMIKSRFQAAMTFALQSDDLTRAALYTHLQSSITGLTVIRAYQQQSRFCQQYLQLTYANLQAYFTFCRLNALLAYIIEMSLHLLIITVLFLLISYDDDPKSVGFSILMLMQLGYMFSLNLRGQIYLDIDMQNVHRVFKTIQLPSEDYSGELIKQWPTKGAIEFRNVYLEYSGKMGLNNVSFSVDSQESIGIVGRTGAGKTSLINALFRLNELQSGSILIDGIDIRNINLLQLRQNILSIPQNCPIFSQSVRFNLDPMQQFEDNELWNVIDKVGLKHTIQSLDDTNHSFSAGQKQLLTLAKVFLDKSKTIIVFDEATSNMDHQTDNTIQQLLQEITTSKLIIAHRLNTVANCSRIIRMQEGSILSIELQQQ